MLDQEWLQFDPIWTEKEFNKGGARDDLGIETLGESILADLLPGINNQTRRARYYSFWAWVLNGFIQDTDAKPHTQSKFWEWLRGREDTFILAYLSHNCQTGLAGTEQALPVWEQGTKKVYPITWKSLLSVDGGSYQLYYRGPLQEMNIIVRTEDSPHDNLSRTIGVSLAEAYGVSVSQSRYVKQYFKATELARVDIEEFAQTGCVCQVGQNETERRLLIEAFFRYDSPDAFAIKRLASLCLFLDVINQSKGCTLSEFDFRSAMYYWSFGNNCQYKPKGNLLQPAERWRIFQLRQYFVFFIETFWSLFLNRIQDESLSAEEYIEWLCGNIDLNHLSSDWGIDFSGKNVFQLSMKEFYMAIQNAIPTQAWRNGSDALSCKINEQTLMYTIRSARSNPEVNQMAGSALIALATLYWRCLPWKASSGWNYVSDSYSSGRLPIDSHLRQVEQAFVENISLLEWLQKLHQNDLWLQHRKVALDKLINRRQEVFKFEQILDEPDNPISDLKPKFRGLGTDVPKMNAPRFPSALNILIDLSVIVANNGGYQLMPDGKRLLEKFSTYTVPQWKEPQDAKVTEYS